MLFTGFAHEEVMVSDGPVRLRRGGSGPPLLLLHGNPQTHAMWHAVAPDLARSFTVVCPDLRGYGGSLKPPATPDHALQGIFPIRERGTFAFVVGQDGHG